MELQGRNLCKPLKGYDIRILQRELCLLGFPIKIDRDFGNKTYQAVVAFQEKENREPTGIVDKNFASLITKRLNSASHDLQASRVGIAHALRLQELDSVHLLKT